MAYVKTNWVNDNPPAINAANLNKIEQGIYEAHQMGGNVSYSTQETKIGTWINGEDLYRKVFETQLNSDDDFYDMFTGINFKNIINIYGGIFGWNGNVDIGWQGITNRYRYKSSSTLDHDEVSIYYGISPAGPMMFLDKGSNVVYPFTIRLIIEYTKTTD